MTEVSRQLVKPGTVLGITTFWFWVESVITISMVVTTFVAFPAIYFVGDLVVFVVMHSINVILTRADPDRDQVVKVAFITFLSTLGFGTKKYPPLQKNVSGDTIYGP